MFSVAYAPSQNNGRIETKGTRTALEAAIYAPNNSLVRVGVGIETELSPSSPVPVQITLSAAKRLRQVPIAVGPQFCAVRNGWALSRANPTSFLASKPESHRRRFAAVQHIARAGEDSVKRNEAGTTRDVPLFGRAVAALGTLHGGTAMATPLELAAEERRKCSGRKGRYSARSFEGSKSRTSTDSDTKSSPKAKATFNGRQSLSFPRPHIEEFHILSILLPRSQTFSCVPVPTCVLLTSSSRLLGCCDFPRPATDGGATPRGASLRFLRPERLHFWWLLMHCAHRVPPSQRFFLCTQLSHAFRTKGVAKVGARDLSLDSSFLAALVVPRTMKSASNGASGVIVSTGTGSNAGCSFTEEPPKGAKSGLSILSASDRERPPCRLLVFGADSSQSPLLPILFFPSVLHWSSVPQEPPAPLSPAPPSNGASPSKFALWRVVGNAVCWLEKRPAP